MRRPRRERAEPRDRSRVKVSVEPSGEVCTRPPPAVRATAVSGSGPGAARPGEVSAAGCHMGHLLPLFQHRSKQVSELVPQWYRRGLALGDCELAQRGRLGGGHPCCPPHPVAPGERGRMQFDLESDRNVCVTEAFFHQLEHFPFTAGQEELCVHSRGRACTVRDRNACTVGVIFVHASAAAFNSPTSFPPVDIVMGQR